MNSIGFVETLWQDLRYGWRVLRKSPGFAVVAVLSLSLGIGANSAIFSLVHAVLLRPLPYPHADQLVRVAQQTTQGAVSMTEYEFWKEHASGFASVAADRGSADRSLIVGARQEWIRAMTVTAGFFRTLGIAPAFGREFNSEETRRGGPRAIVLSDGLWRRVFGADPEDIAA
jgi:putative ABC transport system permease protein